MKQQKYQENQLKHIKGNSHKIKRKLQIYSLLFILWNITTWQ